MTIQDVTEYASSCSKRDFLDGFYDGDIKNDGEPFHLGQTERAIVEVALRAIEQGKSLCVLNPFPADSVPLAICASCVYSQHPNIPGGAEEPLLAFPSTGYVTGFDDFHFQHVMSDPSSSEVIPREVVNSLSDLRDRWKLYTANTQEFTFDLNADYPTPGAAFVDFRKPEWAQASYPFLEEFCEAHDDMPVVFYASEKNGAFEFTCDRLDVEPLHVTNELLQTADPDPPPTPVESSLTEQERILADGSVGIECYAVAEDNMGDIVGRLVDAKDRLQKHELAYIEAATVFNRLTKLPCKPDYWNQRTTTDAYWDSFPDALDRLRRRGDAVGGAGGTILHEFADTANELQGYLNDSHPLQNVVTDVVRQAQDTPEDERPTFVLRNEAEVDAIELAAVDIYGENILQYIDFVTSKSVEPDADAPRVILFPPYRDSYLYEFPPSERVLYFYHQMWDDYVTGTAKEATHNLDATYETKRVGESVPGDIGDHVFNIDELESNVKSYVERAVRRTTSTDDEGEDDSSHSGRSQDRITVELENGEEREMRGSEHVTTYDPKMGNARRKTARNIEVGEMLLLIEETADDIYEVLLNAAHERDAVRNDEALLENWRAILDGGMGDRDMTAEEVRKELVARGSNIKDNNTIELWRRGHTIAPQHKEDMRRVIQLFRPGFQGQQLDSITDQFWRAAEYIRLLHQRIGRNVRRVVASEADAVSTVSFEGGNINESMIRNIANDTERQTVVRIKREDRE